MLPTLVLTDGVGAAATPGGIDAPAWRRHLEPLGPVITWEDGRAEAEGSVFLEGFGGDPRQDGLAPDRDRSSWWEAQASRYGSEVARMQTGTFPRPAQ